MNPTVEAIFLEAGVPLDGPAPDFTRLVNCDALAASITLKAANQLRLFLRLPPDSGGRQPGPEFFECFLGHGRKGAEAILVAFAASLPDATDEAARERLWAGIAMLPRLAGALDLLDWDLNVWAPPESGKERFGVYLTNGLVERTRVAAFATRTTISGFIAEAVAEKLERVERAEGKRIVPRAPTATASA